MTDFLSVSQKITKFTNQKKSFYFITTICTINFLLGLLSEIISSIVVVFELLNLTVLTITIAKFIKYLLIKKYANNIGAKFTELEKIGKSYNVSLVIIVILDTIISVITLITINLVLAGLLSSSIKFVVIIRNLRLFRKSKNATTIINFCENARKSIAYINNTKGTKEMVKKIIKAINANKLSILLSGTGVASVVELILGSPIVNEIFAAIGLIDVPLWGYIAVYIAIACATLFGVKWESIQNFATRISEKKAIKLEKTEQKNIKKLHDEALEEATKQLQEKQKVELETLADSIMKQKSETAKENKSWL